MPLPKYARILLTAVTYLVALGVIGFVALASALVLVGPHGGVLPRGATVPFLLLMWGVILVAPILIARFVWKRLALRGAGTPSSR